MFIRHGTLQRPCAEKKYLGTSSCGPTMQLSLSVAKWVLLTQAAVLLRGADARSSKLLRDIC